MSERPSSEELELRVKTLEKEVFEHKQTADVFRKTDEALRESEKKYRMIAENTNDLIWILDLDTMRVTYASPSVKKITGYTVEEHLNRPLKNTLTPQSLKMIMEVLSEGFKRNANRTGDQDITDRSEWQEYHKDGHTIWMEVETNFIRDDHGKPIGVIGVSRDISERKKAEESLRTSEEKFRAMVENSPMGIAIVNDGYQYVYVNDKFCSIAGYQKDELLGSNFAFFLAEESKELAVERYLRRQRGENIPDRYEFSFIRGNGDKRYGEVQSVVYRDNAGRANSLLQVSDITDRKQAEEEKQKLQGQLLQAQKMESVGRLAGGVAHDFNNMLGVILGHAEMAMDQVNPVHPIHADLEEIHKAAQRSADLTRQLLAFARKQTVTPKVLDLNDTVEGMLKMLQRLIGEDIHLNWRPEANLWPVKVDPSQIDQILTNLCVNARDAIADVGKVSIETGNSAFDAEYCVNHTGFAPGEYVRLSVSDDGCGMDKETLANIFDPFFTTKEIGKGTGLGLAMVYGAVKQNDGFINAYSEPGQGTTFTIYLPRHLADGQAQPAIAAGPLKLGQEAILLVEDEPAILKMTTVMLERQGYTVLAAGAPGEAIRLAREHAGEIHLLMTDVVMPEMNGRDLAKNLLSLYPNLKRLFMSGYTANVISHHGVLDEGVYFIQKPFSIKELAAKVREALDQK